MQRLSSRLTCAFALMLLPRASCSRVYVQTRSFSKNTNLKSDRASRRTLVPVFLFDRYSTLRTSSVGSSSLASSFARTRIVSLCTASTSSESGSETTDSKGKESGWPMLELTCPSDVDPSELADFLIETGAVLNVTIEQDSNVQDQEQIIVSMPQTEQNLYGDTLKRERVRLWRKSVVKAMLPRDDPVQEQVAGILELLQIRFSFPEAPEYSIGHVPERDWLTEIARGWYQPVCISEGRLWVLPSWFEGTPPDEKAINLRIDPGAAFGDGQHQTTRLCLKWLTSNVQGGENVLDYGCGTGVLSVGALYLGARCATAVDIDPEAVRTTILNRDMNALKEDQIRVLPTTDFKPSLSYDIVVANILIGPLIDLAPMLSSCTVIGGKICLSGFVVGQEEEIAKAYSPYFKMNEIFRENDWLCMAGVRI